MGVVGSGTVFLSRVIRPLFLLLPQERAQPCKRIARDHQAGRNHGLGTGYVAIATALLVLAGVGVQDIVLAVTDEAEGEVCVVQDGALDLLGVFFDDGEGVVHFGESVGAEGVGFGDVGSYVSVGTLGVGDEGCNELLVAGVGEVEGFLAIGIGLEGRDGVGDDGIGGEMLED